MIPVDELRDYMGLTTLSDAEVLVLHDLEQHAVQFVETQTSRHFGGVATFVEVLVGTGLRRLWLNEAPTANTAVRERPLTDSTWTVVTEGDDDGWELRGRELLRKNGHTWSQSREYEVTYDFGYAAGTEPGDVRRLVMDLVKMKWDARDRAGDLLFESEGAQSRRYENTSGESTGLMSVPWVAETIGAYRRPRVA